MVDLNHQHDPLEAELMHTISKCLKKGDFIQGEEVAMFEAEFASYLEIDHVIACANGTDALQIALMALDLEPGSEVIVPTFGYISAAEAASLLGLKVVFADVDPDTFLIQPQDIELLINDRTRVIVPIHLFGQSCDMDNIMALASRYGLYVVEDNAQSIGAKVRFKDSWKMAGTVGHLGITSFFPTKNLGCMGDGGAILCRDAGLASKLRSISNHGQSHKYMHRRIGVNSRLDTLQAAILRIKLRKLDHYLYARIQAAQWYDRYLANIHFTHTPSRASHSTHVYNQYVIKIVDGRRDAIRDQLRSAKVPTMVYYPMPLHRQEAFSDSVQVQLPVATSLCDQVLALPMHTGLTEDQIGYICSKLSDILK